VIKIAIVILSEMEEHKDLGRVVNALQTAREFKETGDSEYHQHPSLRARVADGDQIITF